MAIDSSIYFQQQPVQLPNQLNQLAAFGQIQQQQNVNRLAQQQYDQAARANAQAEGLNNLYREAINPDGTVNRTKLIQGAASGGFGSAIPGIQKQFADADKATAEVDETKAKTAKSQADTLNIALQQGRDVLTQANDPASGRQWLIAQYQNPATAPIFNKLGPLDQALAKYDQMTATPEGFAKWRQGAMLNANELVKYTTPDANAVLAANTSRQNNADTNATTRRGQNMTDARARDQIEQGKVPAGYRRTSDGNLEAIPGGPAEKDKSLTETQGKATGFAARMQDASTILNRLEGRVSPSLVSASSQDGLTGTVGNTIAGKLQPDAQLYQQAQENWVTANLRLESGAAIPPAEKQQEIRKWFPQPGDTKEKIAQKAEARKVAERAMLTQAGPGAKQVPNIVGAGSSAGSPDAPPDINDLLKKYGS